MIIVQMAGFPGSGKSTIAKKIAKRINAVVIDKDILKSSLLKYGLTQEISSKLAYDLMFDLSQFYLDQGQSIVLDTPCYYEEIIEKGMQFSNDYHASYKYLDCKVRNFQVVSKRIQLRENMISQIDKPSLEGFKRAQKRAVEIKPAEGYIEIDSSNLDTIDYERILKHLSSA